MEKPDYTPLVLAYDDNGIAQEDIADFVKAIYAFHQEAKAQYPDQKVRYFLLPAEQVTMLNELNKEEK